MPEKHDVNNMIFRCQRNMNFEVVERHPNVTGPRDASKPQGHTACRSPNLEEPPICPAHATEGDLDAEEASTGRHARTLPTSPTGSVPDLLGPNLQSTFFSPKSLANLIAAQMVQLDGKFP